MYILVTYNIGSVGPAAVTHKPRAQGALTSDLCRDLKSKATHPTRVTFARLKRHYFFLGSNLQTPVI